VLALLDSGTETRAAAAWRGAAARYAFLLAATALIRRSSRRRRVAAALTALGTALDARTGRSASAPWFAPVFYTKLLLGHAGAALWPDGKIFSQGDPKHSGTGRR
jgi:hypothetical protein